MEKNATARAESGVLSGSGMRPYILVWAALLALTAITVAVAGFNLQKVAIVVCLSIAAVKSTLVLFYFMHLRHEQRVLVRLIIPIAISALAIFIVLTFLDVITR
jgi:cytochrome c oxidase subunit IV